MINTQPVLFCFRNDLRVSDNPALTAAVETGQPVIACFILDNTSSNPWLPGGASRWWLHHSLQNLEISLAKLGGQLILQRGPWDQSVLNLAKQADVSTVFFSRAYEPFGATQEVNLKSQLDSLNIETKRYGGYLFFEPEQIKTLNDEPYKVFTPFWKRCLERLNPKLPHNRPQSLDFAKVSLPSDKLENWKLLPTKSDWAVGLKQTWRPGEEGAWSRLTEFFDGAVQDYKEKRDVPSVIGTSRLSPHLHFGEITPRQIWHYAQAALSSAPQLQKGTDAFIRELGWRDFSYHLLHHWPHLPESPFRKQFAEFPWQKDSESLRKWQKGQTGIPLVDAGMRELWHTGWMHNRVRMIVASLLVKNLLIPWQEGEAWFWDTLVDADLGNNAAGWQWVAGSGADAAPYFRIFNPVTQSQKFDSDGVYIKQWVPELQKLPAKHIHAPWLAPESVLKQASLTLGQNYPLPIVDLKASRQRALDAYQAIKT
ncbi:MAG: deoxyribodipyrimidine photo-lyase [Pseudomonadota bacterium]